MNTLSDHALQTVFKQLRLDQRASLRLVSKRFKLLCDSIEINKLVVYHQNEPKAGKLKFTEQAFGLADTVCVYDLQKFFDNEQIVRHQMRGLEVLVLNGEGYTSASRVKIGHRFKKLNYLELCRVKVAAPEILKSENIKYLILSNDSSLNSEASSARYDSFGLLGLNSLASKLKCFSCDLEVDSAFIYRCFRSGLFDSLEELELRTPHLDDLVGLLFRYPSLKVHSLNPKRSKVPRFDKVCLQVTATSTGLAVQLSSNSKNNSKTESPPLRNASAAIGGQPPAKRMKSEIKEKSPRLAKASASPAKSAGDEDNVSKSSWSPETIRVCITNTPNSKELSDIVSSLGGKLTTVPSECTHLVSSKVERTVEFVCAFNYARFILDPEWLVKSKESGCFLREHDYFLSDPANEQKFGITIGESLERRRQRENRPLFQDMIFFITRSCVPSLKILIQIVRSADGLAVVKYAPTAQHLEAMKNRNLTFVVISCKNDLHLCDQYYEKDIPVLHSEFVLNNILKQTIEYEPYLIG